MSKPKGYDLKMSRWLLGLAQSAPLPATADEQAKLLQAAAWFSIAETADRLLTLLERVIDEDRADAKAATQAKEAAE